MTKQFILIGILAIALLASLIRLIEVRQRPIDYLTTCDRFKYAYSITVEEKDYKQAVIDCKKDAACMYIEILNNK